MLILILVLLICIFLGFVIYKKKNKEVKVETPSNNNDDVVDTPQEKKNFVYRVKLDVLEYVNNFGDTYYVENAKLICENDNNIVITQDDGYMIWQFSEPKLKFAIQGTWFHKADGNITESKEIYDEVTVKGFLDVNSTTVVISPTPYGISTNVDFLI